MSKSRIVLMPLYESCELIQRPLKDPYDVIVFRIGSSIIEYRIEIGLPDHKKYIIREECLNTIYLN